MKYDISICIAGHRNYLWEVLYESIENAVGDYTWELIMVGPNKPTHFFDDKLNFKFLKDFGTPSRCGQIAALLCEGELVLNAVDDGLFVKDSLKKCIELKRQFKKEDIVIARYTEGHDFTGPEHGPEYWHVKYYPDLLQLGIPSNYYMVIMGVYDTEYFRELGGFDCVGYEHLNMNLHDLAFRAQRNGSNVHFSPTLVMNNNWNPGTEEHKPVGEAHVQNDYPHFTREMSKDQTNRIKIDFFNWTKTDKVWKRRFGNLK